MNTEEWQKRLEQTFSRNGVVGYLLNDVLSAEKNYSILVEDKYQGHSVLSHSFQHFYIESIHEATKYWKDKDRTPLPDYYSGICLQHLTIFRNIRAADVLFHNGYPMDGFARLRHIKDSVIFLAAIMNGFTTLSAINGLPAENGLNTPISDDGYKIIVRNRKTEERRVLDIMIRNKSGLDPIHLNRLSQWETMFNDEVHGARLTMALEHGPAAKGEDTTTIAPKFRERSCGMFMNRFSEVCWMLHRTLPFLQLSYKPFNDIWVNKWHILDDSFLYMEQSLANAQKDIAKAIISMIEKKFPFSQHSYYSCRTIPLQTS